MKRYKLSSFLLKYFPYCWLTRVCWYWQKNGKKEEKEVLSDFFNDDLSDRDINRYHRRMRHAYFHDKWSAEEYLYFQYEKLSRQGRREFVTELEKVWFCDKVNSDEVFDIFYNKGKIYSNYAPYYKREACVMMSKDDNIASMDSFLSRHHEVVIKPIRSSMGKGVMRLRDANVATVIAIMDNYPSGIIAEEVIHQHPEMAAPHPQSVNTVRITTYIVNGKVNIIKRPFMRFGQGDNVVDNGAQGGLFAAIDIESGIVTDVVGKNGKRYVLHPDTKMPLVGFKVPRWEEALSFAKELAGVLPFCRYVGWDLALTEDGWIMVEGNSHGQFIGCQLPIEKGIRSELLSIDSQCLTFKGIKRRAR